MIAADVGIRVGVEGAQQAQASIQRLDSGIAASAKSMTAMVGSIGGAVTGFRNLAGMVMSAASALADFAMGGAAANDILAHFSADLVGLEEAVGGGIDDTSLQSYSVAATQLGLTAKEAENLARELTYLSVSQAKGVPPAAALQKIVKGGEAAFKEFGVAAGLSAEQMKGLSAEEKKLAKLRAIAAMGAKVRLDDLHSESLAIAQVKTNWDNFVSTLQQTTSTSLVQSGILERISAAVKGLNSEAGDLAPEIIHLVEGAFAPLLTVLDPIFEVIGELTPLLRVMVGVEKIMAFVTSGFVKWGLVPLKLTLRAVATVIEVVTIIAEDLANKIRGMIRPFQGMIDAARDAGEWLGLLSEESGDLAAAQDRARSAAESLGWSLRQQSEEARKAASILAGLDEINRRVAVGVENSLGSSKGRAFEELGKQLAKEIRKISELSEARADAAASFHKLATSELSDMDRMREGLTILGLRYGWLADAKLARLTKWYSDARAEADRFRQAEEDATHAFWAAKITAAKQFFAEWGAAANKLAAKQAAFAAKIQDGIVQVTRATAGVLGEAIASGDNFASSFAASIGPLLLRVGEGLAAVAMTQAAVYSGQWWAALGLSAAIIAASAALDAMSSGASSSAATAGSASPTSSGPTTLARPEETRRQIEEEQILIVTLDVDGKALAGAVFAAANRAAGQRGAVVLAGAAVGSVDSSRGRRWN